MPGHASANRHTIEYLIARSIPSVAPPGGKTEIVLAKGFGGWSAEKVGEFSRIVLSMTDAQATYETLRDRGVTFSEPPTAQPWGMIQALFEDQDGNGCMLVGAQMTRRPGDKALLSTLSLVSLAPCDLH